MLMPCHIRIITNAIGAQIPIWLYVGRMPINSVGIEIIKTDKRNVFARPTVSPRYPKMRAPIGLQRKPAANMPNVAIMPALALEVGKKSLLNSGEKIVKRPKSYHSKIFPNPQLAIDDAFIFN